jgi:hypothetical protein
MAQRLRIQKVVNELAALTASSFGLGATDSPTFANPIVTTLNVGHATDTTLARSGAGDITVEGNAVYRAGGTDVPVTDGGTGASSAAGARTNLGAAASGANTDITSLAATGAVTSSGATSGIGYATGAGGTVTQGTSKSTGVELNKISGQITTHNAALGSNSEVSFTVTNSTVAATDVIVTCIASGATADAYNVQVDAVAAGSFRVAIANMTAGSLSEALVINFVVIKAVAA